MDGRIETYDWSPDGNKIAIGVRYLNGRDGEILIVDVKTFKTKSILKLEHLQYILPKLKWTPDGKSIIYRSNQTKFSKLYKYDLKTQRSLQLTKGNFDDYNFIFSETGTKLIYSSKNNNAGGESIWIMDLNGKNQTIFIKKKGLNFPLSQKGNYLYGYHVSPTERGDLWKYSLSKKEEVRLTNRKVVSDNVLLTEPEEMIFDNSGNKIYTLIYKPHNFDPKKKYPAIVWIHGGPAMAAPFGPGLLYNYLANQGYVVAVPSFIGSLGFGVDFCNAVSADGVGKNDFNDVLFVRKQIEKLNYVDAKNIGAGGRSWGGYLGLMCATKASKLFKCVYAGSAISDWYIQQSKCEVRYYDNWLMGGWVKDKPELVKDRSPANFVKNISTPLYIYHGMDDRDVPFEQIEDFVAKLKENKIPFEYKFYEGAGNQIKKPEHVEDLFKTMNAFFAKHLKPWNFTDNPGETEQVLY